MTIGVQGFQKGHLDFVSAEGRKRQADKIRFHLHKSNYFQTGHTPWFIGTNTHPHLGISVPHTDVTKAKISKSKKGQPGISGPQHYAWNPNRDEVSRNADGRNDSEYRAWRKRVWLRDNFQCRINDQDCSGTIVAHHILNWSTYPELRYEVNNGITLCHSHHPKKRSEEKRLVDIFKVLILTLN